MRRPSVAPVAVLLAFASGCGSAEPGLRARRPIASALPPRAPATPPPEFVLTDSGAGPASLRAALPGGGRGFIAGGTRFVLDGAGKVTASVARTESLLGVQPIPVWMGAGFLFQASDALFRADDFLGELRPIAESQSGFASVTFGPRSLLVVAGDGERSLVDPKDGTRSPVVPRGASVFGATSGNRGVAIADGGFAYLTSDGGKTWTSLASKLLGAPKEIVVEDAVQGGATPGARALFVVEASGGALRVDETTIVRAAVGPRPADAPRVRTTRGEGFLALALRTGAPLGDASQPTEAIVPDGGALYTVSLETGAVVSTEAGAVPPDLPCQAERFSNEVLVLCHQGNRSVVATRPLLGSKTTIEASFTAPGTFVRGEGDTLLFTGPCKTDAAKPGQACLRVPRSDSVEAAMWADLDRSVELADAPAGKAPTVVAWIPNDKGATVVLGGSDGGLLDTRAHTRTHLSEPESAKLEQAIRGNASEIVERRFHVLGDGTIEGWSSSGIGIRISEGGKVIESSAFSFPGARVAGPRALALSPQSSLWQSTDWGRTFVEVLGPPIPGPAQSPRECSDVGCNLGDWSRIGWQPRPPVARPPLDAPPRRVVPTPPSPVLPMLSCTSTGATVRKALPALQAGLFGFGAKVISTSDRSATLHIAFARALQSPANRFESASLRALLVAKQPEVGPNGTARLTDPSTDRHISFIDPFDPKAVEKHASIKLDAIVAAVTADGGTAPDLGTEDESGMAVPILSDAGGIVLTQMSGPPLWVRDTRVTPMSFGADGPNVSLLSAVETKPDELAVLVTEPDGTLHARRLHRGGAEELFSIPAPPLAGVPEVPDALAISADGSLAIIRVPAVTMPTAESPAFLLRPGQEPVALAPWSTVRAADDPLCADGKGWRAIITSRRSWLSINAGQPDEDHLALVRARWSPERVCLEAAEVPALSHDLPAGQFESYVALRLGKDAAAGHVLVAGGAELREPRSCILRQSAAR